MPALLPDTLGGMKLRLVLAALVFASCAFAAAPEPHPLVLKASAFSHYTRTSIAMTRSSTGSSSRMRAAWDWMRRNVPLFECPDRDVELTYYFRWWTYRKHLRQTPDGFVITEFLPNVPWAGKLNTISCAAGHHFYEGRWIADPQYLGDYAVFWLRKGGEPRRYSFWPRMRCSPATWFILTRRC